MFYSLGNRRRKLGSEGGGELFIQSPNAFFFMSAMLKSVASFGSLLHYTQHISNDSVRPKMFHFNKLMSSFVIFSDDKCCQWDAVQLGMNKVQWKNKIILGTYNKC